MAEPPFISIIIPTFNRPGSLSACLEAVAGQDYPRDRYEVIVVDDGSETSPEASVDTIRDRVHVRLVRQPNLGPSAARNSGAAVAKGEFLAFTDNDCLPEPDWLTALAACFAAEPFNTVGGRTLNALEENPYAAFSQMIIDVAYRYYNRDPDRACFFASNNLAIPADGFRAVGGFDPGFRTSEDRELCDRWLHLDRRMTYAPRAVVRHANELSLSSFCRQHFNYGRGAFRFYRKRALRGSGGFMPDAGFYLEVLRASRGRIPGKAQVPGLFPWGLPILWLTVNTLGFGRELLAGLLPVREASR